jgi:hypothetical protein
MNFGEVLEQMLFGHKMRRPDWKPDTYIKLYITPVNGVGFEKKIYKCDQYSKSIYVNADDDLLANDWEIYE